MGEEGDFGGIIWFSGVTEGVEDFGGITWFSGVMEGAGRFWDHMVFRGERSSLTEFKVGTILRGYYWNITEHYKGLGKFGCDKTKIIRSSPLHWQFLVSSERYH